MQANAAAPALESGPTPRLQPRRGPARRRRELLPVVQVLAALDPELSTHGESVARLATLAGRALGLPHQTVRLLGLAGLLHDVGKVVVPPGILEKAGPLSEKEWIEVRRHSEVGCGMLRALGLDEIAGWVLAHHERPDGSGYPFGLGAGEIPLEASILSACDAYHAMTAERPYQRALPHEEAIEELRRCACSQFDPRVVEALIEALEPAAESPLEFAAPEADHVYA